MSFTKPHAQRQDIGQIDYVEGREESIELPRGRILERAFLDLSYTIKKNGAEAPTYNSALSRIYQLIDRLTVVVGSDEIWKISGPGLKAICQMDFGENPIQNVYGSLLTADEEKVRIIMPLSFDNPALLKPLANALDLRGAPNAFIKIRWRDDPCSAMFADKKTTTLEDVVCNVIVDPFVNSDPSMPLMPVRMIEMQDQRVYENRDRDQWRIRAGTDINIRRLALLQTRGGEQVNRHPTDGFATPILSGKCEVYSGATKWRDNDLTIDWAWSNILRERSNMHSLDVIDFTRYGNRAEMVPTSELGDDIVIESAVVGPVAAEECLVQIIIDAVRAPRWPVAQRA